MPRKKTTETVTPPKKSRFLGNEEHHCSQCNRPKPHRTYEHEDGVTMECTCGYSFVDVRVKKSETEEVA